MNDHSTLSNPRADQLNALLDTINKYRFTNKPVTATVELIVSIQFHEDAVWLQGEPTPQSFYKQIIDDMYGMLGTTGNQPQECHFEGKNGKRSRGTRIKFSKPLETNERVTFLWTADGHQQQMKGFYLDAIAKIENEAIKSLMELDEGWSVVKHAKVTFLLSKPFTYEYAIPI